MEELLLFPMQTRGSGSAARRRPQGVDWLREARNALGPGLARLVPSSGQSSCTPITGQMPALPRGSLTNSGSVSPLPEGTQHDQRPWVTTQNSSQLFCSSVFREKSTAYRLASCVCSTLHHRQASCVSPTPHHRQASCVSPTLHHRQASCVSSSRHRGIGTAGLRLTQVVLPTPPTGLLGAWMGPGP